MHQNVFQRGQKNEVKKKEEYMNVKIIHMQMKANTSGFWSVSAWLRQICVFGNKSNL